MNCPYCDGPMEHGRIETNAVLHVLRYPATVFFESDDFYEKRKVSSIFARREGWYCPSCKKIIGIFDVSL